MDALARLDTEIFRLINGRMTAALLDSVMPFVTEKFNFLGAIIAAAVLILILGRREDRWGLLLLVIVVASSDITSTFFKKAIMRVRPCSALEGVRLLVGCGGAYSLPSGHATNIFAAMVFLTARYRRFFPVFLSIAVVVSYSRVYVGVHYPSDVIAGAALGTAVALAWYFIDRRYYPRLIEYWKKKRGAVEV